MRESKKGLSMIQSFPVKDYDLGATLNSGQAFRWAWREPAWVGVIGNRWVRLHQEPAGPSACSADFQSAVSRISNPQISRSTDGLPIGSRRYSRLETCALGDSLNKGQEPSAIVAETVEPVPDWKWLTDYLQLELDLDQIIATFPKDEPMRQAIAACRGLRLLRQDPWECLASFILSSTKQIVQIRQIVATLCERYGEPIPAPSGFGPICAFPSAERLAGLAEADLRACKMGFRAPYLLETARLASAGQCDLEALGRLPVEEARAALMRFPGVGRKIADCVLLFAYGFPTAFPVDVWVVKALRALYFPRRRVKLVRLHGFAASHFGPNAGYAQQYLFHCVRTGRINV
jgi:N-glycosylase/DNA lyase